MKDDQQEGVRCIMSTLTKQERSKKIGDIVEKVTQMYMNIHQMSLLNLIMRQRH